MSRVYFSLSVAVVLATLAVSAWFYPGLPERVPMHWNIHGQVDGYGPKSVAAFLMPGVMAALLALFLALPWLSPKHFELDSFRDTYWFIVLILTGLIAYIQGVTLWAAAGGKVDVLRAILAGLTLMFGLIGNVLGKVRRNFWVGVRTPWTLASERVWNDTHRLAGRMFVAAAGIGFVMLLLPLPTMTVFLLVIGLIMASAIIPAVYSAVLYKSLEGQGQV